MLNVISVATLGFFLGMGHATDADHVIAVSTIVSRQRSLRSAGVVGMMWGFGHSLTVLGVGAAILLFNLTIPIRVALAMELAVGVMLVVLGLLNLTGVMRRVAERFEPGEGDRDMPPRWLNGVPWRPAVHTTPERIGRYQILRPLIIGVVHGLAGSAAVALLVLATIRDPVWSVAYLLVFGVGTVAGMMLMTMAIGAPLALAGERHAQIAGQAAAASGLISLAFGIALIYRIGFVEGLATGYLR